MAKKIINIFTFCLLFVYIFLMFLFFNIPFKVINSLPSEINISNDDIYNLEKIKPFGKFINLKLKEVQNCSNNNILLEVKLFNMFNIKNISLLNNEIDVFANGNAVGFSLYSNGVVVVGSGKVETETGVVNTIENSNIKVGDIIFEIEDEKINKVNELSKIVNKKEYEGKELNLKIRRKDKILETKIKPAKDVNSKKYKLGLWIKDETSGVGTLTYVRTDNKRFGALGHSISENGSKEPFKINGGDMYKCNVIGINKGLKGKPGEIKALFIQGKNAIGEVDKNNKYGVFGNYNKDKFLKLDKKSIVKVGGRFTAKPGKAKIRCCLEDKNYEDYDIEIIKTNYQNSSNEKSMVIRVTDKRLINKTGGIVQGMSGSPILQNGKIIGAVTHVFISDPTKGFGVYLDWMINE